MPFMLGSFADGLFKGATSMIGILDSADKLQHMQEEREARLGLEKAQTQYLGAHAGQARASTETENALRPTRIEQARTAIDVEKGMLQPRINELNASTARTSALADKAKLENTTTQNAIGAVGSAVNATPPAAGTSNPSPSPGPTAPSSASSGGGRAFQYNGTPKNYLAPGTSGAGSAVPGASSTGTAPPGAAPAPGAVQAPGTPGAPQRHSAISMPTLASSQAGAGPGIQQQLNPTTGAVA